MTTTTELEMAQSAIDYAIEEGRTPDPKLVALRDALLSGERSELPDRVIPAERGGHRPAGGADHANQYGTCKVRVPSDAQVRFIAKLLAERVVPAAHGEQVALAAFKSGRANLRQATDLISWLLLLPVRADAPVAKASEKQIAFIRKLADERDGATAVVALIDRDFGFGSLTPKQASEMIEALLELPKLAVVVPVSQAPTDGIYRKADGRVYKVYGAQADRSRKLAKLLVIGDGEPRFEYAGMAHRFVTLDERMTLEDAKAFGVIYGVCCVCGATLTDETSIERGIGPICEKRWAV